MSGLEPFPGSRKLTVCFTCNRKQQFELYTMVTAYSKRDSYAQLDLLGDQQELINRVRKLAQENFAPRAAACDLTATFPVEDFEDLFRAGLNAPVVPTEHRGLGL